MQFIVIPLFDHTTEAEAQELAEEVQASFQFHYDPFVAEAAKLPKARVVKEPVRPEWIYS